MEKVLNGNIHNKPNGERGWIIGDFKDHPVLYPFHNKAFAVKWARLNKGDKKDGVKSDNTSKTLTILVEGKQKIDFPETSKSVILEKEGDYVFFEPGVSHSWEALENNLTITLRWPV